MCGVDDEDCFSWIKNEMISSLQPEKATMYSRCRSYLPPSSFPLLRLARFATPPP